MAPSTNCGMPQLPLATTTASGAAAVMPRMLSASSAGPTPQLAPIAAGAGARVVANAAKPAGVRRSEEHTSELQSLMRISYAVFCLKKKKKPITNINATKALSQEPIQETVNNIAQ